MTNSRFSKCDKCSTRLDEPKKIKKKKKPVTVEEGEGHLRENVDLEMIKKGVEKKMGKFPF